MKKCWVCEKDLEVIKDQPYHYKESGLDNVYLHGIIQYKCSGCGEEAAEIPNIEDLHLLIGKSIICNNEHLSAREVVYLKKELGLKSKDMAELLSVTPQEYLNWENSMVPVTTIKVPRDQNWFWTKKWQKGEAEAHKKITKGDVLGPFNNIEALVKELHHDRDTNKR